ncbi:MAG: hypothetical protein ABWZ08_14750 [Pseudoxanthomonas sp.]
MSDDNGKFDKEAIDLIESLKGRRKPAKRAPRTGSAAKGDKTAPAKTPVVVRRAAGRF